ncbi:hypothetical protein QA648_33935 (plasmid) [Rhizobium sp. CB3171]|uniref:hypothetical protein n=1 Tax=Rhizobium sp. CB3171 TaxID=3039157 RepID=UPI0024B13244|nr:hypothetical protein [Rhizobium sp. CB3171]WFU06785.1 hypothetical protein QA648_33935 [Rhizobium sp. CB3171]
MKTIEAPQAFGGKSENADPAALLKQYESAKLIQEMQTLIKKKGLKIDLIPQDGRALAEPLTAAGCDSCTVCPCMICW